MTSIEKFPKLQNRSFDHLKETLRTFEKAMILDEKTYLNKKKKQKNKSLGSDEKAYTVFNNCEFWPDNYYQQVQRSSNLQKCRNMNDKNLKFTEKSKKNTTSKAVIGSVTKNSLYDIFDHIVNIEKTKSDLGLLMSTQKKKVESYSDKVNRGKLHPLMVLANKSKNLESKNQLRTDNSPAKASINLIDEILKHGKKKTSLEYQENNPYFQSPESKYNLFKNMHQIDEPTKLIDLANYNGKEFVNNIYEVASQNLKDSYNEIESQGDNFLSKSNILDDNKKLPYIRSHLSSLERKRNLSPIASINLFNEESILISSNKTPSIPRNKSGFSKSIQKDEVSTSKQLHPKGADPICFTKDISMPN